MLRFDPAGVGSPRSPSSSIDGRASNKLVPGGTVTIFTDTHRSVDPSGSAPNGVGVSYDLLAAQLKELQYPVRLVETQIPNAWPVPGRPEIMLEFFGSKRVANALNDPNVQAVHIATEGPIGLAAMMACLRRRIPFTTSFHTHWPQYGKKLFGLPLAVGWQFVKLFHNQAVRTLTRSGTLVKELVSWGISRAVEWNGGVDLSLFSPSIPMDPELARLPKPIMLYVGRVEPEKNLEAFLNPFLSERLRGGSKVVVGTGSHLKHLQARYPDVIFLGGRDHKQLGPIYRSADVFVFPSKTDTFGLVIIEALACGKPVAAFPAPGPVDILSGYPRAGALSADLEKAVLQALAEGDARESVTRAYDFAAGKVAKVFLGYLAPFQPKHRRNTAAG